MPTPRFKASALKDLAQESRLFHQRLTVIATLVIVFTSLLFLRLFYLQVIQSERYATLSSQNQLALLPLAPRRGLIYDRNGVLLAQNIPAYNLEVIPSKVPDLNTTLAQIETLIPLSEQEKELFYRELNQKRSFDPVTLKVKLSDEEVAHIAVNQYDLPGVRVHAQLIREYPFGEAFSHVIGYVGRLNDTDLDPASSKTYAATQYIGKENLEKQYETILHGLVGFEQIETNASGHTVRTVSKKNPTSGSDLYLTLDSSLQIAAQKALDGRRGAIVAIEVKTGEILAIASAPSFDPNPFVKGISHADFQALQNSPDHPLYNRAARGQYPMASTIKPFIALKGLDSHAIEPNTVIEDPGYFKLEGSRHAYKDWAAHGNVTLDKAITLSCDTYFYQLAMQLGIEPISEIIDAFGFGHRTGLDLPSEVKGLVAHPNVKLKRFGTQWYPGDTINSGIGQGLMLSSPLQLAQATAMLANKGVGYRPHLLKEIHTPEGHILTKPPSITHEVKLENPKLWDTVIEAMGHVVPQGTGRRFGQDTPYTVAAKTGTAQVFSTRNRAPIAQADIPERLRDHSLFIAFAPVEDPQIAIAVIAENDKRLAPALARKVLDYYFLGDNA